MSYSANGKIIPAENVRVVDSSPNTAAGSHPPLPGPAPDPQQRHEPKITLVKDGETVRQIHIKCTCGEILHLDCEY